MHVIPKNHTIIKHIEKNSTNDNQFANTSTAVINSSYPIHKVLMVAHGWLFPIEHLRLHWVDWTQKSKWYEEIYVQGGAWVTKNLTSPSWAAGYYFEIKTDYGNSPQLFTTLWWDGWVGGIYCNDLHFHTKGIYYKINFEYKIIWNEECKFPH